MSFLSLSLSLCLLAWSRGLFAAHQLYKPFSFKNTSRLVRFPDLITKKAPKVENPTWPIKISMVQLSLYKIYTLIFCCNYNDHKWSQFNTNCWKKKSFSFELFGGWPRSETFLEQNPKLLTATFGFLCVINPAHKEDFIMYLNNKISIMEVQMGSQCHHPWCFWSKPADCRNSRGSIQMR